MKELRFVGTSLEDLRDFPELARRHAGYQLHQVQCGLDPDDWKPMTSVGNGVREIRINIGDQFRVLYVTKFENAVYVLHAFQKKTQQTPKKDIDLAKQRLKHLQGIKS